MTAPQRWRRRQTRRSIQPLGPERLRHALRGRAESPTADGESGFAIGPILYLLLMAGVAAGVLFSGYSQILRANLNVTNSTAAKGDLNGSATTLSATGVLSEDQLIFCPPRGQTASDGCVDSPQKLVAFGSAEASKLPTNYTTASASGSPLEVGVFAAGAGVKQLDPWGRYYIYCRWENPRSAADLPATAVISAGANGKIETGCGDETADGDDQMSRTSVGEAINRASVWQQASDSTEASFGAPGSKVTVTADGIIEAKGLVLSDTATLGALNLTTPLPVISGGTGSSTQAGARLNLGSGVIGDALFVASTATMGRSVLGATEVGQYLFSGSTLVEETASTARVNLLGAGTVGNDVFLAATTTAGRAALGATTMGNYLFSTSTYDNLIAPQVRATLLGATSIGDTVFTAGSYDVALTALGGTDVGKMLFQTESKSAARITLGAGNEGSLLFTATSQLHAWEILGLTGTLNPYLDISVSGAAGSVDASGITGGAVPIVHGGTSATTASSALDNLFGSDVTPSITISPSRIAANSITSAKLNDVVSAGTYSVVEVDSAGRVVSGSYAALSPNEITDGNGNSIVATSTGGGYLYFSTAGEVQMTLSPLGYLGLGIKTPEERLHVYDGNIRISNESGESRELQFTSGTSSKRWIVATDATSESGSSAGSNFAINRVTDSGTAINAMTINRATGNVTIPGQVAAGGGFLGVFTGTFSGQFSGGMVLGDSAVTTSPHRQSDETTGLFSNAESTVSIATAGVERLRVTGTGSVGIGTSAPVYPLDVVGTAAAHLVHFTGTETGAATLAGTATGTKGAIQYNDGNNNLAGDSFLTWNAGSLYLGIGTATPRASIDAGYATNAIVVPVGTTGQRPSSSAVGMIRYNQTTGLFEGYQGTSPTWSTLGGGSAGSYFGVSAAVTNPSRSDDVTTGFFSDATGAISMASLGVERLRLTSAGSLGLGTITPVVSLDLGAKTDAILLPLGTTEQRPASASAGMMRYNSTLGAFEGYTASGWGSLGSSSAASAETAGQSYVSGWPDSIVCNVTDATTPSSSPRVFNALYMPYAGDARYYYVAVVNSGHLYLAFESNGSFSSYTGTITSSDCAESISTLVANGKAFNLVNSSTSNAIAMDDGTAAAPGLYFGADTNTGLYRPASDVMGFATGGTERMRLSDTGALGIKTTALTAGAVLDLGSATGTAFSSILVPKDTTANRPTTGVAGMIRYNTTLGAFEGYRGVGAFGIWATLGSGTSYLGTSTATTSPSRSDDVTTGLFSASTSTVSIAAGGVEALRATASGFIGIGTTGPIVSLDLLNKTDAIRLPIGTSAQRPSTVGVGMMRYNSSLGAFEGYTASGWGSLGSSSSSTGLAGQSMLSGWPDAIICYINTSSPVIFYSIWSSSSEVGYAANTNSYGTVRVWFSPSTRAYSAGDNTLSSTWTSVDCFTNGWSIDQYVTNGRAFNFVNSSTSNAIAMDDGTAAAPGLYFGADTNTGLYRPADDTVGIATGGVERMRLTASGYVGIGGTTASTVLNVYGPFGFPSSTGSTATDTAFRISNTTAGASGGALDVGQAGDSGSWIQSRLASDYTTNFSLLLNPNGGRVGIGTTTPIAGALLDLSAGTATSNSSLLLPKGTTTTRPTTGVAGMMRYNTTLGAFEGYTASGWGSLGSSSSSSGSGSSTMSIVTSSRALGTVYQNTTGSPLFVGISSLRTDGVGGSISANVGASSASFPTSGFVSGSSVVEASYPVKSYATDISFVVPPNYYYKVTVDAGTIQVDAWVEWTLGGGTGSTGYLGSTATVTSPSRSDDVTTGLFSDTASNISIATSGTERLRLDGSGHVGVGASLLSVSNASSIDPRLLVVGSGVTNGIQAVRTGAPGAGGAQIVLSSTRGVLPTTYTTLQSGDGIGTLSFNGADGSQFEIGAIIVAQVDGTVGTGVLPTRLVFKTNRGAGSNVTTEAMRIDSAGRIGMSGANTMVINAGSVLDLSSATGTAYSSLILPKDTTANRPTTGVAGMMRYNTTLGAFEGYTASGWGSLGSGSTTGVTTAGQSMASGWPDVVMCSVVSGGVTYAMPYYLTSSGTNATYYRTVINTAGDSYLGYTAAGAFSGGTIGPWTSVDCITNATTIATLVANGKAFNIVNSSTSNAIAMDDGTAAAPGLYFGADTNTGLYRPAADNVGIATGGVERLRVTATGSIGFGTTTPTAKLQIQQSTDDVYGGLSVLSFDGTSRAIWIGARNDTTSHIESGLTGTGALVLNSGGGGVVVGASTLTSGALLDLSGGTATSNSSLLLPKGATTTRPTTGVAGMMRYNTTLGAFEGYTASGWGSLGSGSSTSVTTAGQSLLSGWPDVIMCNIVSNGVTYYMAYMLFDQSTTDTMYRAIVNNGGDSYIVYSTTSGAYKSAAVYYSSNDCVSNAYTIAQLVSNGRAVNYVNSSTSNAIAMDDGTAAAPGLYFGADTNTGLYRPAADTVGVATGGVEQMRVTASGFVGIGTAAPTAKLEVFNTGTSTTLGQLDTNLRLRTGTATANAGNEISFAGYGGTTAQNVYAAIGAPVTTNTSGASGYLTFATKAASTTTALTEAMRITATGSIGIGTTTPTVSLDLSGRTDAINLPVGMTTTRPTTGVAGMMRYNTTLGAFEGYTASGWGSLGSGSSTSVTTAGQSLLSGWPDVIMCNIVSNGVTYYMAYMLFDQSTTDTMYRAIVNNGGDSYIVYSTTNGAYKSAAVYYSSNDCVSNAYTIAQLVSNGRAVNYVNSSTSNAIAMDDGTSAAPGLYFGADTNTGLYRPAADTVGLATGGVERMRVTASGYVGIGTTAPTGTLQVQAKSGGTPSFYLVNSDFVNASVGSGMYIATGAGSGNTYTELQAVTAGNSATGNLILNPFGGSIGIGTASPTAGALLDLSAGTATSNSSLLLPKGTSVTRPTTGVAGMMRYNTTLGAFEGYTASGWGSLGSASTTSVTTAGQSIVSGWPDAILCTVTSPGAWGTVPFYITHAPNVDGTYIYRMLWFPASTSYGIIFSSTGAYSSVENSLVSDCNSKSIATLVSSGKAFNLVNSSTSNAIAMDDGTAAAPGLYFGADTNTGLYRPAADNVGIATGGVEQLRVTASGYVGIGTTSPNSKLSFGSHLAPVAISSGSARTDAAILLYDVGADNWSGMGNDASGNFWLKSGTGSTYYYLTMMAADGRVGIGTTAPIAGALLDLSAGTATSNSSLLLPKGATTTRPTTGVVGMMRYNTTSGAFEGYTGSGWGSFANSSSGYLGTAATTAAPARSDDATTGLFSATASTVSIATGGTERLRVTATGSVGIGTLLPAQKLDIAGDVNIGVGTNTYSTTPAGSAALTLNGSSFVRHVMNDGGGNYNIYLNAYRDSSAGTYVYQQSTAANKLMISNGTYELDVAPSGTVGGTITWRTGLYIDNNANVGIGTASPTAGALLDLSSGTATSNSSLLLPKGTTVTRPTTGVAGMMRYNTTLGAFEGYTASGWGSIGGSGYLGASATVTSPSRSDDVTTGLFSDTASTVSIAAGSVEVLRATASGNVGIGITSPLFPLHISSSKQTLAKFVSTDTNARIGFDNASSGVSNILAGAYGSSFGIWTGGSTNPLFVVDSTGNVGIGMTTPTVPLTVTTTNTRNTYLTATNTDYSVPLTLFNGAVTCANGGQWGFGINGTSPTTFSSMPVGSFWIHQDCNRPQLVITPAGNVGIMQAPTAGAVLDLSAGTTASNSSLLLPRGTTATRPTTGAVGMIRYNTTLAAFEGYTSGGWNTLSSTATSSSSVLLGTSAAANNPYRTGEVSTGLFSPATGAVAITSLGTEALRVTASGYVGIGNTAPAAKLDVTGDVNTTGNLALGGAGLVSYRGLNMAQTSADASKVGIYNSQTISGTQTAARVNYGVYSLMSNSAVNGSYSNGIQGIYSDIINATGGGNATEASLYGRITNNDASATTGVMTGVGGLVNNAAAGTIYSAYGGFGGVTNSSTGTITSGMGTYGQVQNTTSGTIGTARGLYGTVANASSGTISTARALEGVITNSSGSMPSSFGVFSSTNQLTSGGTIGTNYSYYAQAIQSAGTFGTSYLFYGVYSGTFTTKWGLYLSGETSNYLSGTLGVMTSAVTAGSVLDLSGATGTAYSSFILPKDTTVNRPTTGVAGMMRYNTTLGAFEGYTASGWGSLGGSGGSSTLGASTAANSPYRDGEVTTGLFSPASGSVAITSLGTEVLRTTASGYVGIGNTAPAYALDVIGAINATGNLAVGGAGVSSSTAINVAQGELVDTDSATLASTQVLNGDLSANRQNYGTYIVMDSSVNPNGNTQNIYGNYSIVAARSTDGTGAINAYGSDNIVATTGIANEAVAFMGKISPSDGSLTTAKGISAEIENGSGNTITTAYGSYNLISNTATIGTAYGSYNALSTVQGTIGTAYGSYNAFSAADAGDMTTTAYGSYNSVSSGSGVVMTAYGSYNHVSGNTLTGVSFSPTAIGSYSQVDQAQNARQTSIGYSAILNLNADSIAPGYLYYGTYASGSATSMWGLYLTGETANYLSGKLSLGTTDTTYPLQVGTDATNGAGAFLSTAGVWVNASDRRLKEEIEPIAYGLADVMKLKPVSYQMKKTHQKQIGFIAQDVAEVLPEVVSIDERGHYGLSYGNMLAATVKAVQELKGANDTLAEKVKTLTPDESGTKDQPLIYLLLATLAAMVMVSASLWWSSRRRILALEQELRAVSTVLSSLKGGAA